MAIAFMYLLFFEQDMSLVKRDARERTVITDTLWTARRIDVHCNDAVQRA
jgi:hypothetical protein